MSKVSRDCLVQILSAIELYKNEVNSTPMKVSSKNTYILHADHFVRWLQDDFEPGVTLKNRRR